MLSLVHTTENLRHRRSYLRFSRSVKEKQACRSSTSNVGSFESVTAVTAPSTTQAMFTRGCLQRARLHLSGVLSLFSSTHTVSIYCNLHIV